MTVTPDLLSMLKAERRATRARVAMHAGRALVVQPEQFEPLTALELVTAIPYVSMERADEILRAANVYPLRTGAELREHQRVALARQLARFARGES